MSNKRDIVAGAYVVVTTARRGVFGGVLKSRDGDEVTLTDARVCVHWSSQTRGFIGLAATGPLDGSRVSAAAPQMVVCAVTSIVECTDDARARWEAGPWK